MLFDTHAHLNDERYDEDLDEVIQRSFSEGTTRILIAAYDMPSSIKAVNIAGKDDRLYCSVGIHPHDAKSFDDSTLPAFERMITENRGKVVAIGEIGLDYYYDFSPRELQREVFLKQIQFAVSQDLPFIVHDRDAHHDCLEIVSSLAAQNQLPAAPGIFHCYSGSFEMAKTLLSMGFYLSFGGPVTFKNAKKAAEFIPSIPLDRILLETDCPYLTPEPLRGKRNEPAYVKYVAERISALYGLSMQEIGEITTANACRIFKI